MQFPVPQFTDVEDKIIGPLGLKQFGILFGVGILVFLGYSLTKSLVVAIFLFLLLGLPALALALVPFNGRPMYNFIGKLIQFLLLPKQLIFHKESANMQINKIKDAETKAEVKQVEDSPAAAREKIRRVEDLLNKASEREKQLAGQLK